MVPTTKKVLVTLRVALEFAVSEDLVAVNVARGVKVEAPRGEGPKEIVPPSKDALRKVLDVADPDFRLKLIFAASTGCRAGEQWAVRWKDIDLETCDLHVRCRVDAYGEEGPPKTEAGEREIPLSDQLVTLIKEWRLRSKFSKAEDLVFPNRKGGHTCHDNFVKREFKPTLKRAGVSGINWHALRHSAISTWIEQEYTPKGLQTFAGAYFAFDDDGPVWAPVP